MVEYSGYPLLVLTITLVPVRIICVMLRLIIRYKSRMPFGWDDITITLALASQLGCAGVILGAIEHSGLGYHTAYLQATGPNLIIIEGKYRTAGGFLYITSANLPKISILFLYRRLFAPTTLRTLSSVLIVILVTTIVIETIALFLACRPFAAFWDVFIPASKCVNVAAAYAYGSIPNIVTDVVMLFLPVPVIWSLHTSIETKIQLTFTFALGSLGLILSILRLVFFLVNESNDFTWTSATGGLWSEAETALYLICACIITFKPLLDFVGIIARKGMVLKLKPRANTGPRESWVEQD